MRFSVAAAFTALLPALANAVSSTDEYQDADPAQSGYLPNHNIDPTALSTYGHAWTYTCNASEFFSAKPLTYTPNGYSHELVIFASQQNIVRVLDGLSGQLLYSRVLDPPFQASDSNCGDISPTIGITGTPIIDPNTDIMYFFSKGYKNGAKGPVNTLAGQYKFYAVQLPALTNIPGYPIIIDGNYANNDNTRYFVGGTLLQRPGLAMIGNSVVAGFGGHCDNFNYTGMLVSVHKSAAVVNNIQAMVTSPYGPAEQNNYLQQSGGKAGIWHGGMGLAVYQNNVYFATGNGVGAGVNKGTTPYSGKVYSGTLEQVVAKFAVDPNSGGLTQADWFEPFNFDTQLDGGDRDMASAGVALLDRTTFNAPGVGVNGIAVGSGKDGIVYIMNADNLGGFYNGAGNPPDATLQQITTSGSFYGGVGSSPIDGGYLYVCPTGGPLYAYSYGLDGQGNPLFTLAGQIQTSTALACNGNPTVTSLNGKPGSGVVWLSDVNAGLLAFHAVPVNGVLVQIPLGWSSGRLTKYQRPAFGNGRVYTIEQNMLYAIAPPPGSSTSSTSSSTSSTGTSTSSSTKATSLSTSSTSLSSSSIIVSSSSSLLSSSTTASSSTTSSSSSAAASSSVISSSSGTTVSSSATSSAATSSSTSTSSSILSSSSTGLSTTSSTSVITSSSVAVSSTSSTISTYASTTSSTSSLSSSIVQSSGQSSSSVSTSTSGSSTATSSTTSTSTAATIYPTQSLNPLEPAVIGTFKYIGCYKDLVDGVTRSLSAATFAYDPMTLENCASNCTAYDFFGVEYHRQCYCGYNLNVTFKAAESDCKDTCSGNSTELCGAASRLSVYQNRNYIAPPPPPAHEAQSGNYSWIGCYSEVTTGPRALSAVAYYNNTMTVEACMNACAGYTYAGLEFGRECYCGNTINAPSALTATSNCNLLCPGSSQEYCGAANFLDMYNNTGPATVSSTSVSSTSVSSAAGLSTTVSSTSSSSVVLSITSSISSSLSPTQTSSSLMSTVTTSSSIVTSSSSTSSSSIVTSSSSTSSSSVLTLSSLSSTTLITSTISSTSAFTACSSITTSATGSTKATATSNPAGILRTYNWNIGWVNAAPDGYTRAFVGVNGQWPCPAITANIGDIIKINVLNNLGNETTAVHFHGLHQGNTTFEDGAAMVSQCPIGPGESFVYEFTLTQSGTYWYHAHVGGQYVDGFRGPVIIRDNIALANYGRIDGEYTLSLTDVYHVEAPYLINYFLSANNYNGAEPVPDSALINEGQNAQFNISPGKTYMFHVVNMGALAGQFLQFDQHNMTIIEADGVYTQPYQVSQLFVAVAQRYTVLITAKPSNCQNFAIVSQFLTDMFDSSVTPAGQQATCTAYLVYNSAAPLPVPFKLAIQPWSDTVLVPWDQQPLWDSANVNYVYLTVDFEQNDWGSNRAAMNGLTYIPQQVPTFFTALTAPAAYQMNPQIYGQVNPQIVQYGQVVEIDLNNHDTRAHPFHLHGHQFQIINRAGNEPQWPGLYNTPAAPMRRDTVVVYPGVGVTIRFIANNPGIWLFHCHTEFHVEAGMTATFIEAPDVMVANKPYIPNSHNSVCDAQKIPRKGNAGGNSVNWLDLSNANTEPSQTYYGALINPPAVNPYTGGAD